MPILQGDIKLLASQIMDDVPEGGGAPTAIEIPDGASNAVFQDVSEVDRAGGAVSLRKLFAAVQTDDTDTLLDLNLIVEKPPLDPMVSVTLFSTNEVFDRRADFQQRLESYLIGSSEIPAFLLENHIKGQRAIQLFYRQGVPAPNIGRTLLLVLDEGLPTEKFQYVRVIRTTTETRTFTASMGGSTLDFDADVVLCELSDGLRYDFPGSPPSRFFTRETLKTKVRDTIAADAGSYYGVTPLRVAGAIGEQDIAVDSVYTQLVPSARSETSALDQRPGAQRTLTLATVPRRIDVGVTPHSLRIKIGQENRGFNFVQILKPFPAPNTIVVSFRALGQWYTLQDNGTGALVGAGVGGGTGTVVYTNGSISVTLPALPDIGSAVIFSWGENSAFQNRAGTAQFRAPEYALKLDHESIKPGTLTITWTSATVLKTATDNGTGALTGDAVGEINYASGLLLIRPSAMIDAGGQFNIAYQYANVVVKVVPNFAPDAAGFGTVTLDDVPASGTISATWMTARSVSNSSGATSGNNSNKTSAGSSSTTVAANVVYPSPPPSPDAPAPAPGPANPPTGGPVPPAPPVPDTVPVPAALTRIPLGGAQGTYADGSVAGMFPAGRVASSNRPVYIAIAPTFDGTGGGYYDVPTAAANASWTDLELQNGSKVINGQPYYVWNEANTYAPAP